MVALRHDKRDDRIYGVINELRILLQLFQAPALGIGIAVSFHNGKMPRERHGRIINRLLKRIAGRHAAGHIGEADTVARVFVLVDQSDVTCRLAHRGSFNPACL